MSSSIYDIPVAKIGGEAASLSEFKGKVLLMVNVASKCGLTPQYEGLENLYERLRGQGLVIAGFPANDFKEQEPGTNDEIQKFCTMNFGVKFPMFSKIAVTGAGQASALFGADCRAAEGDHGAWADRRKARDNIERQPRDRAAMELREVHRQPQRRGGAALFAGTAPDAPELVAAIETELAKSERQS